MKALVRLVVAALVVATAGLALAAPAAYAAPCTGDNGVSVVVDFNGLGGGVQQVCVPGGGGDLASSLFPAAGFPLSYASRQPGFVCRVRGVPTSDPCVNTAPADAFWGLWWSDGDASSWSYSSLGAASLRIPDGGMVAFSWDGESGTAPPSASASHPDPQPTPEPTAPPSQAPEHEDQQGSGPGAAAPSDEPSSPGSGPSSSGLTPEVEQGKGGMDQERSPKPKPKSKPSPGASPTDQVSDAPETAADQGSAADPPAGPTGLAGWVAPGLIAVLFAVSGVVLIMRRRRAGT